MNVIDFPYVHFFGYARYQQHCISDTVPETNAFSLEWQMWDEAVATLHATTIVLRHLQSQNIDFHL